MFTNLPPRSVQPPEITPFTYPDGVTNMEILRHFKRWIEHIEKNVTDALGSFGDDINAELAALRDDVETALTSGKNYTDSEIAAMVSYVDAAVQSIINNSIEVQDPVVATLIGTQGSDTQTQLATDFADKATQATVETGRLSETQLATDFADKATQVTVETGRLSETQLSSTIVEVAATQQADIFEPIDDWSSVDVSGVTYSDWITELDARLAGAATKTQIGTAPGGEPIFVYTVGNPNAPHILVNAGIHGPEVASYASAREYFIRLATSNEHVFLATRSIVQVSFIPMLSAGQFRGVRENSNGVDLNRNWPLNWSLSSRTDKGALPLDQPEAVAFKNLLDSTDIAAVIDCHNEAPDVAYDMNCAPASSIILAGQQTAFNAMHRWERAYGSLGTIGYYGESIEPTLRNWVGKYLAWDLKRPGAASMIVEGRPLLFGSTHFVTTAAAVQLYAGIIHSYIVEWALNGQKADVPVARTLHALRSWPNPGSDTQTPVGDGGNVVTSFQPSPIHLTSNVSQSRFLVPMPFPGVMQIDASVSMLLPDEGTTPADARIRLGVGLATDDGSDVPLDNSAVDGYAGLSDELRNNNVTVKGRFAVPTIGDKNIYQIQLFASSRTHGTEWRIRSALLQVTYTPDYTEYPHTRVIVV